MHKPKFNAALALATAALVAAGCAKTERDRSIETFLDLQKAIAVGDWDSAINCFSKEMARSARAWPEPGRRNFAGIVSEYGEDLDKFFSSDAYIVVREKYDSKEDDSPRVKSPRIPIVYFLPKNGHARLVSLTGRQLEKRQALNERLAALYERLETANENDRLSAICESDELRELKKWEPEAVVREYNDSSYYPWGSTASDIQKKYQKDFLRPDRHIAGIRKCIRKSDDGKIFVDFFWDIGFDVRLVDDGDGKWGLVRR